MRSIWIIAAAAAASTSAGAAQAAELVLDGVIATVVVIPEARSDVVVQVQPGRAALPAPTVERIAGGVRVQGGRDVNRCSNRNGSMEVRLRGGGGEINLADAPVVTVRAPRSLQIRKTGGAVMGRVGATQNLDFSAGGCSQWTIGDVSGTLDLSQSGGASVTGGSARRALLRASGGGSIRLQSTADLQADASGGGVVRVQTVSGPVSAEGSGGGGVKVAGGQTGVLRADASGGGWVDFDGVAASLEAEASGGGRVDVARVTGAVSRRASGGGFIRVGN